jgi:cation transport ATPase
MWRLLRFIGRSTKRMAVLLVGLGVVCAGLVMLVTPGPGLVVIIAGLAILATEFTWAEILLERAKRQARKARDSAVRNAGRGLRRFRRGRVVDLRVSEMTIDLRTDVRPEHGPPTPDVLRCSRYVQTYAVYELTESIESAEERSRSESGSGSDSCPDRS